MSEKFDIEELLRGHLSDASEPSPSDVFERIDAQLSGKEKRKKRFFIWFWFGTGMLLLCVGTFFVMHFQNNDSNNLVIRQDHTDLLEREKDLGDSQFNDTVRNIKIDNLETESTLKNNTIENSALVSEENVAPASQKFKNEKGLETALFNQDKSKNQSSTSNSTDTLQSSNHIDTSGSNKQIIASSENDFTRATKTDVTTSDKPVEQQNITDFELLANQGGFTKIQESTNPGLQDSDASQLSNNGNGRSNDSIVYLSDESPLNPTKIDTNQTTLNLPQKIQTNSTTGDHAEEIDSTQINPNKLSNNLDTIPSNLIDTMASPVQNRNKNAFGLLAYGGYLAFDQAVFKSYFSSGNLSKNIFPSMGYEIGLGGFYRIKNRFELSFFANYGERQTQFNYDLMVSQDDFLNKYENDIEIPLENLDEPNSCNCFLAQDANLDYKIQTISIALTASYNLIYTQKYRFGPSIGFGTIAHTKFTNQNSSIISFSSEIKEQFIGSVIQMGFNLNYQITPKTEIGFAPRFNFQFVNGSKIYAKNSRLILVPLQLKLTL